MNDIKIRDGLNVVSGRVMTVNDEPSMTKQSHKDDCCIERIISKFDKTGLLDHRSRYDGQYGEFEPIDYHEAMQIVTNGQEMFDRLPSTMRARFNYDPGLFLDFVNNPANVDEMVAMGLATKTEIPAPPAPPAPSSDPPRNPDGTFKKKPPPPDPSPAS